MALFWLPHNEIEVAIDHRSQNECCYLQHPCCIKKTTCYAGGSKKLLAMSRKNYLCLIR
jgi:hypothetical protein